MAPWDSVIRFVAEDGNVYFAPIKLETNPEVGARVEAFSSMETLEREDSSMNVMIKNVRPRQFRSKRSKWLTVFCTTAPGTSTSHWQPHYLHWPELPKPCDGSKGWALNLICHFSKGDIYLIKLYSLTCQTIRRCGTNLRQPSQILTKTFPFPNKHTRTSLISKSVITSFPLAKPFSIGRLTPTPIGRTYYHNIQGRQRHLTSRGPTIYPRLHNRQ